MLTSELVRKIRRIEISTRRVVHDNFAGRYHSVFKGQGMEFDEVRPYNPGDDVRRIDWNVTARTGSPYVRRYHEERETTVMLALDASGSSDFGSAGRLRRELAAEMAAVLSYAATTNNDKVGLLIFTDGVELLVPPRKGKRHVLRLIRDVLVFEPRGRGTDIGLALDTVNRVLKRQSIVFVVSDFLADVESYGRSLAVTNRRHDVVAVQLSDPMEREVADVGLLSLQDAETGEMMLVDTSDPAWRRLYAGRAGQAETDRKTLMARAGVDRITVAPDRDYVSGLMAFFTARARRQGR